MPDDAGVNAETDRTKALLRRFEIPLLQFATRITGDRERARDIVQETFVQFERKGPVSLNGEPATWLFTVCRNRALNVCRKERWMTYLDEEMIDIGIPLPYSNLGGARLCRA
jgi:RNA polymerase sigma factor (sigma-70 family)